MADIWRELLKAAIDKKVVTVRLPESAHLRRHKRRPGRPTVRGGSRYAHYAGWQQWVRRPRCAHRGCEKYLRRGQRIACCDEHHAQAVSDARALLVRAGEV